jgi:hypothetical protein
MSFKILALTVILVCLYNSIIIDAACAPKSIIKTMTQNSAFYNIGLNDLDEFSYVFTKNKLDNIEECALKCKNYIGCKYFVYVLDQTDYFNKKCLLWVGATTNLNYKSQPGWIAGSI